MLNFVGDIDIDIDANAAINGEQSINYKFTTSYVRVPFWLIDTDSKLKAYLKTGLV